MPAPTDPLASRSPFPPAEARRAAYLELVQAQRHLEGESLALLKTHGLSLPQWDALSVLRRAGSAGLPSKDIARNMEARLPDITRLVDRLLLAGHVRRERSVDDRRIMRVTILPAALDLLASLDKPMSVLRDKQFERMSTQEVRTLRRMLGKLLPPADQN